MIEVQGLTKVYQTAKGPITAVEDASFAVGRGEIVGLLGPNGAGKTTIVKCILGLLIPTPRPAARSGCAAPTSGASRLGYSEAKAGAGRILAALDLTDIGRGKTVGQCSGAPFGALAGDLALSAVLAIGYLGLGWSAFRRCERVVKARGSLALY